MFVINKYIVIDAFNPLEYVDPINDTIAYYYQEILSYKIHGKMEFIQDILNFNNIGTGNSMYLKFPIKNTNNDGTIIHISIIRCFYTDYIEDIMDDLSHMYESRFLNPDELDLKDPENLYNSEHDINIQSNRIIRKKYI